MKLYERIIEKCPTLFTEKDIAEIRGMLADKPDNKYLVAAVMTPYIEDADEKDREARLNYLAFMDEVEHKDGPFARKVEETPSARLSWIYPFLHEGHPLYHFLVDAENAVRTRKGVAIVEDVPVVLEATETYTTEQETAFNEIKNEKDNPTDNFWWPTDN